MFWDFTEAAEAHCITGVLCGWSISVVELGNLRQVIVSNNEFFQHTLICCKLLINCCLYSDYVSSDHVQPVVDEPVVIKARFEDPMR